VKGVVILALAALLVSGLFVMAQGSMTDDFYPQHEQYWTGRVMNGQQGFSKHNADLMYGKDPPDDKWQGWVKINLAEIPDDAVILSASLFYYVVAQSDPAPATCVTLVGCEPVAAEPTQLWDAIATGTVVAPELVSDKGWVERELNADGLAGISAALVQDWVAFGLRKTDETETKGHAKGYEAERFRPYLRVTFAAANMAVEQIVAPVGEVCSGSSVQPVVLVSNKGDVELESRLLVTIGDGTTEFYRQSAVVAPVPAGESRLVGLPAWTADPAGGERIVCASLEVPNDADLSDNSALGWFDVIPAQHAPQIRWGWEEVRSLPLEMNQKTVRAGAWLANDPSTGLVYAARGSKTGDFYSYNPATGGWRGLARSPFTCNRGARAVADGKGHLFVVRGSSTFEFWQYDIRANTWSRLPDVPAGISERKVKTGTDMVHVEQFGLDYVYLLKGPGCDFVRYNVQARTWQVLGNAPAGAKAKWANGSWLVYDGASHIYAHKAAVHEMWVYDLEADAWQGQLPGMPFFPPQGPYKAKRSKEGSSGVWSDGALWSLKAGNTGQFFRFNPESRGWTAYEPMPGLGSSRTAVSVGQGSDMVGCVTARALYALKGNKTLEFWRYVMPPVESLHGRPQPVAGQVQSERGRVQASVTVGPNPVATGFTTVRFAGMQDTKSVSVYDAQGRLVLQRVLAAGQDMGSVRLDLRRLSAGTYSLRVAGEGQVRTTRLVIAH